LGDDARGHVDDESRTTEVIRDDSIGGSALHELVRDREEGEQTRLLRRRTS
jgi:hypothetical protein